MGDIPGSNLLGQDSESAFGGFANVVVSSLFVVICELGVIAESSDFGDLCEGGRSGSGILECLSVVQYSAFRSETGTLHGELIKARGGFVQEDDLVDAHLVGGQSSSLVRADDTAASQCLNGWQASYDGVLGGHLAGSQSEAGSDDDGETFRNGGNSEGDGDLKRLALSTFFAYSQHTLR